MSIKSPAISFESCGLQVCSHPQCWQAARNFAKFKRTKPRRQSVNKAKSSQNKEIFDDLPMMTIINLSDDYGENEDKTSDEVVVKKIKNLERCFEVDFTPAPANTPLQSAHRFNEDKLIEDKQKVLTFLKRKPEKPQCRKLDIQCPILNQERKIFMWFNAPREKNKELEKNDSKAKSKPSFYFLPVLNELKRREPNSLLPQTPRVNYLTKNSYFRPSINDSQANTRINKIQKKYQETLQHVKLSTNNGTTKLNKVNILHQLGGNEMDETKQTTEAEIPTEAMLLTMSKLKLNEKTESNKTIQAFKPRKYRPITCVSTTSDQPGCVSPPAKPFRYFRGSQDIRLEPLPTPPPPSPSTERDSKYDSKLGGSTVMAQASSRGSSLHGDFTLREFPLSSDENKTDQSNYDSEKQTWPKQEIVEKIDLVSEKEVLSETGQAPSLPRTNQTSVTKTNQTPVTRTNQTPVSRTNQTPVTRTNQTPVLRTNQSPISRTNQSPISRTNQTPTQTPGILRNSPAPPPPSPEPPTPPPDLVGKNHFNIEKKEIN